MNISIVPTDSNDSIQRKVIGLHEQFEKELIERKPEVVELFRAMGAEINAARKSLGLAELGHREDMPYLPYDE